MDVPSVSRVERLKEQYNEWAVKTEKSEMTNIY